MIRRGAWRPTATFGAVAAIAAAIAALEVLAAARAVAQAPGAEKSPRAIYLENCALCHGEDARGVYGPDYYGPSLIGNGFVRGRSDEELIEFLKVGRAADAPTSTMHILMPPAGYLSPTELAALVRFLRGGS
jgi:mono/diheme cytochrome c family protein